MACSMFDVVSLRISNYIDSFLNSYQWPDSRKQGEGAVGAAARGETLSLWECPTPPPQYWAEPSPPPLPMIG